MAIPIDSLEEGKKYIFLDRNLEIIKLFELGKELHVVYEYLFGKHIKVGQCSATEFAAKALRDYNHDPEFEGIYPYIFVANLDDPEKEAALLNRSIVIDGEAKPVKTFIIDLVEQGYRPAFKDHTRGLYYKDKFLSVQQLSVPGMRFAVYLSKLKGWDAKPVHLPDFYLES